jgi:hypothetical protein
MAMIVTSKKAVNNIIRSKIIRIAAVNAIAAFPSLAALVPPYNHEVHHSSHFDVGQSRNQRIVNPSLAHDKIFP